MTHPISPGTTLKFWQDFEIQTLDLKAHTLGLIGYYCPAIKALFPGDALFSAGCGRLFEGTGQNLFESMQTIYELPDETWVYCTHEYTSSNLKFANTVVKNKNIQTYSAEVKEKREQDQATVPFHLGLDKKINPFLLTCNSEFQKGFPFQSPAELALHLRQSKDNFR